MRWAMGEQSPKHLRGKGMQDIIFAGSEGHAPVGMAEVSLVFDTSDGGAPAAYADYPEVQIARRLYRTGESEYLINKTPCRLRDVQDFFRDTGIGTHGYTIVEQGQIAGIVSARPEDRRVLIEEAAGISKYKARRHEAELKIKGTTQNLTRVEDILGELRRQKNSLERQAKKALRYKRLQSKLRTLDLSISHEEYGRLKGEIDGVRDHVQAIGDESTALEVQMTEREVQLERSRVELTEAEQQLNHENEALFALRSQIKEIEGRIGFEKRERTQLAEANEARQEELRGLREQLQASEIEFRELTGELETVVADLGREQQIVESVEDASRSAVEVLRGVEREREVANKVLVERLTSIAGIENRISSIEERGRNIEDRVGALKEASAGQLEEVTVASQGLEELETRLAALVTEREGAEWRLGKARESQATAAEAFQAKLEKVHEARRLRDERGARLTSLRQLIERGDDVGEATRHLLQGGDETKQAYGIRALVRDVLEVDGSVESAVGAVLAERAEALVLTSDGKALSAIAALREAKAGRGVFILDQPTRSEDAASSLPGQALIELVRPKQGFEGTVGALLRGVRLVDELAPILERFAGSSIPATFVSKCGDVLTADGVVKGGGEDSGAGLLAHVREARELETEVERLDVGLASAEEAFAEAESQQTTAQNEVEACRQGQHNSALAVANQERDLGLARERCRALTLSEERRTEEIAQLTGEQDGLIQELTEAEERLSGLRVEQGEVQQDLERLETSIDEAARTSTECRDRVTQCKVDRAGRMEKRDRLRSALGRAEAAMSDRTEWIGRREAEIQGADERSQALLTSVETNEGQLLGLIRSEEEARSGQETRREAFDAKSTELRSLETQVRELRGKSNSSKETLQSESLKLQQIEMRLEHVVESIREKWDLNIESWVPPVLENEPDGEYDLEAEPEAPTENFLADVLGEPAADGEEESLADEEPSAQPISMDEAREARRLAKETGDLLALGIDERREHLEDVRRKLNSLGEVNVSAIEEHEEVGERFRFLSEQKDDLEATIDSLREAIARINRTSRKRFRETFEAVNENFKKNFPRLFRGGKAELILLESDDVLDAGIDIIAMPPGKRLQNITLLSGGEKTMTAIALLVSLFQVHPSPFFLLDEVDAALDDANVGRFNEIVKEMADQSQFLVISHNKRTIEMADILHGVTMEHRGVSKLVSVELA